MELSKQVISLEIAQRLHKLGVSNASYFLWREGGVLGGQRPQSSEILPTKRPPTFGAANEAHSFYHAYTVAELGEILPTDILHKGTTYWLNTARMSHGWSVGYVSRKTEYSLLNDEEIIGATEANARGLMLCYLKENNLL